MKVILSEDKNEGIAAFLGKEVTLFCANYFYHGTLAGIDDTTVKLTDAHIVYETGEFTDPEFKDAQRISSTWYVKIQAIESFGRINA